ncbi:MAG TPA: DinB family protein, partial [Myxococcaceae bacterium]|nr:DinB family protein [Myxococcaceae bacterium]
ATASASEVLKKEDGSRPSVLGPREGYTVMVGTLVSMLTWMRNVVLRTVKDLSTEQLDFLLDSKANSIGALLLHLAATETYYALHTFDGLAWDSWPESVKRTWDVPSNLGERARKEIRGKPLSFYLDALEASRAKTLAGLKQRDDAWLMKIDSAWPWGPTNNFCKWFHVCEHESNHNGQMKLIAKRMPGAKASGD